MNKMQCLAALLATTVTLNGSLHALGVQTIAPTKEEILGAVVQEVLTEVGVPEDIPLIVEAMLPVDEALLADGQALTEEILRQEEILAMQRAEALQAGAETGESENSETAADGAESIEGTDAAATEGAKTEDAAKTGAEQEDAAKADAEKQVNAAADASKAENGATSAGKTPKSDEADPAAATGSDAEKTDGNAQGGASGTEDAKPAKEAPAKDGYKASIGKDGMIAESDAPKVVPADSGKQEQPADAADKSAEEVPADDAENKEGTDAANDTASATEGGQKDVAADPAEEDPASSDAEEPAAEDPSAEEPAEEPAEEKPADEEPAEEKPVDEEPANEEPAEEMPADETPAAEVPAKDDSAGAGSNVGKTPTPTETPAEPPAAAPAEAATQPEPAQMYSPGVEGIHWVMPAIRYHYAKDVLSMLKRRGEPLTLTKRHYAMPAADTISIYEEMDENAREIGTAEKESLLYVLHEEKDWTYVESGEVRGFVREEDILTGNEIDASVALLGEGNMQLAEALVDPGDSEALFFTELTANEVFAAPLETDKQMAIRYSILSFASQFLGRPYLWGGEDLWAGSDCSGFVRGVYAAHGIELPRVSRDQAETGIKIPVEEAMPGDLIFYAEDGVVNHVLIYMGDGKAINAKGKNYGVVVSDVNYDSAVWACTFLPIAEGMLMERTSGDTQAVDLFALGDAAYNGNTAAQQEMIQIIADMVHSANENYGVKESLIIAQVINESGWIHTPKGYTGDGTKLSENNNILGINDYPELTSEESNWYTYQTSAPFLVPQWDENGAIYYRYEIMKTYLSAEDCIEDYIAAMVKRCPELRGNQDLEAYAGYLQGYTPNPHKRMVDYYGGIIAKYGLEVFD